jgi:enoyl-CoA hydratase/carnithine racemase
VHLSRLSGQSRAADLLDGWIPGAAEAKDIGLIEYSVSEALHTSNFRELAKTLAERWV